MKRSIHARRLTAICLSVVLLAGACGRDDGNGGGSADGGGNGGGESSPGITDDTVKLGGSYPQSGPASAYATIGQAVTACFDQVNDEGGVEMGDGQTREIEFTIYDDAYQPDRAVQNARRLVEQDEVFALFNTLGTPNNEAIREYLNNEEVPQVFVATGASTWGAKAEELPWTIGWQPAYPTEAAIYGEWLKEEHPDATVAILYQNDDYGQDYKSGFEASIEDSDIEIVAEESFEVADPSVDSQMVSLAQSDADVFFNIATPKFAAQAIAAEGGNDGWDPIHLVNSVSASITSVLEPAGLDNSEGVYSAQYLKEPSDPQWEDDEAMQNYKEAAEEYGDFNVDNPFGVFGFGVCSTMVAALENMEEPTREALMDSIRNLDFEPPLALPDVKVATGEDDPFPIEAMQLVQFTNGEWEPVGDLVDFEGETPVPE